MTAGADWTLWLTSALALVLGGVVKGSLGVGLPLISVPVLSLWLPAGRAIGLLAVPVVLSNLVQAREGALVRPAWQRFRWLIAAQFVATIATVRFTADLPSQQLGILVAVAVLVAVGLMWAQPRMVIEPQHERGVGIAVGLMAGVLGGASSLTGPVFISYLMALGLRRDEFVRSISLIYLCGSLPIYGAMLFFGRIAWSDVGLSVLALVPVYLGMQLGQRLRQRLADALFRRVVLVFLVIVAGLLLLKAAG